MAGALTVTPDRIRDLPALTVVANPTGATTDAQAVNGVTLKTMIGLGSVDAVQFGSMTLNGALTANGVIKATGSGVGSVQLSPGGNPQVGLVEWLQPNGARTAYMGYNGDANLTLGFDQGGALFVGGGGATSGGVTVNNYLYSSAIAHGNGGGAGSFVARAATGAADREAIFGTYRDGGTFFGVARFDKSVLVDNSPTSGGLLLGSVTGDVRIASNNVVRQTIATDGATTFSGVVSMPSNSKIVENSGNPSYLGFEQLGVRYVNVGLISAGSYGAGIEVPTPLSVRAQLSALEIGFFTGSASRTLRYGISQYGGHSFYGPVTADSLITANGGITSPHASYPNTSEQFGHSATAGDYSVSMGRNASSGGNAAGVAVGYGATSDYSSVALGYIATAGWQGVALGANATTFDGFGYGAIAIGKSSQGLHEGSIALGYGAITSAANQLMIGAVTVPVTQQRFMTGGGSLTFANETGTFLNATNAGLIGIGGTHTPVKQLDIRGTADIYLRGAAPLVQMYETSTGKQTYLWMNSSGHILFGNFSGSLWKEPVKFEYGAGNDTLTVNSQSHVLVGTPTDNASGALLQVAGAATASDNVFGGTVGGVSIGRNPNSGSYATLGFNDYYNSAGGVYIAGITGRGAVLQHDVNTGTLILYGSPSATAGATRSHAEHMRFDLAANSTTFSGNVGIATTAPQSILDIVVGTGDGQIGTNGVRVRGSSTYSNCPTLFMGVSNTNLGGANAGHSWIQHVHTGGAYNSPLVLQPIDGGVLIGPTALGPITHDWRLTAVGTVAIKAPNATVGTAAGRLAFAGLTWTGEMAWIDAFPDGLHDGGTQQHFKGYALRFGTISGADINGSDGLERMRITSTGNLLYGTTTDDGSKVRLVGNHTTAPVLKISATADVGGSPYLVEVRSSSGGLMFGIQEDNLNTNGVITGISSMAAKMISLSADGSGSSSALNFASSNLTAGYVSGSRTFLNSYSLPLVLNYDQHQFVGVDVIPLSKFHVTDTNRVLSGAYANLLVTTSDSHGIDIGGSIGFGGGYSGTNLTQWAGIAGRKENGTALDTAAYLAFSTRPSGGQTTERMRISSTGAATFHKTATISGESGSNWLTVGSAGSMSGGYDTALRIVASNGGGAGSAIKWETSGGSALWSMYNYATTDLMIGPHAPGTSPMFKFSVSGTEGAFTAGSQNGTYQGKLVAWNYNYGTITTGLHLINTENAGGGIQALFGVGDSNGTVREGGWIRCDKSAQTVGTVTTDLVFGTTNAGTTASEVLRLASTGLATFAGGITASGDLTINKSNAALATLNSTNTAQYSSVVFQENSVPKAYVEYINSAYGDVARRKYLEAYIVDGGFSVYTNATKRLDISDGGVSEFFNRVKVTQGGSSLYLHGDPGYDLGYPHIRSVSNALLGLEANSGSIIRMSYNTSANVVIGDYIDYGGQLRVKTHSTAKVALVAQGATSQSANVFECWDGVNNVLASVSPSGNATFGAGTGDATLTLKSARSTRYAILTASGVGGDTGGVHVKVKAENGPTYGGNVFLQPGTGSTAANAGRIYLTAADGTDICEFDYLNSERTLRGIAAVPLYIRTANSGANTNSGSLYLVGEDGSTHASFASAGGSIYLQCGQGNTGGGGGADGAIIFRKSTTEIGRIASTGAAEFSGSVKETYKQSTLDPTTSDIASGKRQGWLNTVLDEFRDWVNVGGVMRKSSAYT
jgi:hypothetical protein